MKNKQKPISIIRLYKLANIYLQNLDVNIEPKNEVISKFLKYVNQHKNDEL